MTFLTEVISSEEEEQPFHIAYARDFVETQIDFFEAHEVTELLKLKEAIEKKLLFLQNTENDPGTN